MKLLTVGGAYLVAACLTVALAGVALAETASNEEVWIRLKDGSRVAGRIVEEKDGQIEVTTPAGGRLRIARTAVESILPRLAGDDLPDPNDSRLFFAPTGRPLRKGIGQFTVHELMFPGVSYGLTDNVTLMGGFSILPGLSLEEQLVYFAPKIGARVSERFAVSAGYLFARVAEEGFRDGAGIGFAVATYGGAENSLTAGLGVAHSGGDATPILMVGGQARLGRRLFFLSENWLILSGEVGLGEQPFSAGLRFCGDRVSVDFGLILVGELIEEGFPMPWLAFSYRFGSNPRQATSRPAPRTASTPAFGPPAPAPR